MKQFLPFATLVVISLLSVFSCQEKVSTSDPDNSVVVTGEATNISCLNAELSGNVKLPEKAATGVHFGMLYSTSSDVTIDGAICKEVNNGNFSIVTDVLEPETEYYYRSYLVQNGEVTYGQTKSFTTLALYTMIQTQDVGNITHKGAQLNAMLNLNGCRYTSREYGFELTSQGDQTQILQSHSLIGTGFTYNITKLIPDTEYLCVAYVKLDGKLYKGEPKNFSTLSNQASFTTEIFERKSNSVEIRGKLNFPQGSTFNNRVFIYYSSTESTLEGLTSKSIFLPNAGYRVYGELSYYNENSGLYWTSSLFTDNPDRAFALSTYRNTDNEQDMIYPSPHQRFYGLPVRPVIEVE